AHRRRRRTPLPHAPSLHDALPILFGPQPPQGGAAPADGPADPVAYVGDRAAQQQQQEDQVHLRTSIQPPYPPRTMFCSHPARNRSEEHTSELQSRETLVCRLLLEK